MSMKYCGMESSHIMCMKTRGMENNGTIAGCKPGTDAGCKPVTDTGCKPGTYAGCKPGTDAGCETGCFSTLARF